MKFPNFTDLDAEQRAIYSGAPMGESILVMGPPGTGKTVMAFHRAETLKNLATKKDMQTAKPTVMMFSKVLATYAGERGGVATNVPTSTMHSWVWRWYQHAVGQPPPNISGNDFAHDWMKMLSELLPVLKRAPDRVHWGHIIIDEGQDFPESMYQVLSTVSTVYTAAEGHFRPAITVFADDNQRINETNCTLSQIQEALALKKERVFRLKKNYRNSKQIAQFARHYYVGLSAGVPDVPTRSGRTAPRVVLASSLEVVRRRIANFAINNPDMDIGVLCPRDSERKRIFNSLSHRLAATNSIVQTYAYRERNEHPPENLKFDTGGSVTILNFQSAKGLEFDAVFIIDPFDGTAGASDVHSRMQLYVMTSRARDYLEVLMMNPPPNVWDRLPPKEHYEKVEE